MDAPLLGFPASRSLFPAAGSGWRSNGSKSSFTGVQRSLRKSHDILDRHYSLRFRRHLTECCTGDIDETNTFYRRNERKLLVKATSGHPIESDPGAYSHQSAWDSIKNALDAFYRFSRPHTIIGTTLSIISVSLLSVHRVSDISYPFFIGVLEAVAAALMMNIYIVGLNQLTDVDIDKVNKPYLPVASGEYSMFTGIMIVASSFIMSFMFGGISRSTPLIWALFVSFVIGTAYSVDLPLLRWKRLPMAAAMCIVAVRAVIVQVCFYLHIQTHVFQRPAAISRSLIFATSFMTFFSIVIALFKDIPDIEGDNVYGINTYSVRLGQERVFWICISLLEIAYGIAILIGATSGYTWSKIATVLGHAVLALVLYSRAKSVDLKSKAAITSCYMFIWKLFYAEYLLLPLVR